MKNTNTNMTGDKNPGTIMESGSITERKFNKGPLRGITTIVLVFLTAHLGAVAQTISGPTSVGYNQQNTYTITFNNFRTSWNPGSYGTVHSSSWNGTIQTASISFNGYGNHTLSFISNGSTIHSITVNVPVPPLSGGTIGNAQSNCGTFNPGTLSNVSSASGGTGTKYYQWQKKVGQGGSWTNVSGATSTTYNPPNINVTTRYRRRVTANGQTAYSNELVLNVYSLSPGLISNAQTICYGGNPSTLTNASSASSSNGASVSYQWQISTNNSSWSNISGASGSTYNPPTLTSTRYYRRRASASGCSNKYTNTITVTVYGNLSAGSIGSAQTICYGTDPGNLSNTGSPSGGTGSYSYQWQISTNNSSWSNISGATGSSYNPNQTLTSNRWYRRRVISGSCDTKYTSSVKVTVASNLTSGTIGNAQTICWGGDPAAFTNTASASGGYGTISYQWQSSSDNSSWTSISGATGSTYNRGPLTTTTYYRRRASSANCSDYRYTSSVLITVMPKFNGGVINGAQTICYNGDPGTFNNVTGASGGNGSITYQWQFSTNNSDWFNIDGATIAFYNPPAGLTETTYYRREANAGCSPSYTIPVEVTVYPNLSAGSIGSAHTICYGADPNNISNTTSPSGGAGSYTYQWQISVDNSNWNDITGATGSSYNSTQTHYSDVWYRRKVTSGSCGAKYTSSVKVAVASNLSAGSIGNDQTICWGSEPAVLTNAGSASGGNGTINYQWESSDDNQDWANIDGANGSTYEPGNLTLTKYFRRKATSANCSDEVNTSSVTITVLPKLNGGSTSGTQTICYNTIPEALGNTGAATGGTGTYNYQWQSSPDNIEWTNILDETGATYYFTNPLLSMMYYRRAVASGNCLTTYTLPAIVTVNPDVDPGDIGSSQTICFNSTPNTLANTSSASGGNGSYSYLWQVSIDGSSPWSNITGAIGSSFTPPNLMSDRWYRRSVTSCGSTKSSSSVKITVNDDISPGSIGTDQTICWGSGPGVLTNTGSASGGYGTINYLWQSSDDNSIWTDITEATSATYDPGNLTLTKYFRRKATSANCSDEVFTSSITITVLPKMNGGSTIGTQTICFNTMPDALVTTGFATGGTGTYSYQWQSSPDSIDWTNILDETGATYYFTNPLSTTTHYRREVTSGCNTLYTLPVTVTVNPDLDPGDIGSSQTICYNYVPNTLQTIAAPSGGDDTYTYQWQISVDSISWVSLDDEINSSYTPPQLTSDRWFRRYVTSCGSTKLNPSTVKIKVLEPITSGSIENAQTICWGGDPTELTSLSLPTGGTGAFTYQWESYTDTQPWSIIDGANSATYDPGIITDTTSYRRIAISSGGCGSVISEPIEITVLPKLIPGILTGDQIINWNGDPESISGTTATGGVGGFDYQWQWSTDQNIWDELTGETGLHYNPPNLKDATYYQRLVSSGSCENRSSNSVFIDVPAASLSFTSPTVSSDWDQEDVLDIIWTTTIDSSTALNINLVDGVTIDTNGDYIAEHQYSIGSVPSWIIPNNQIPQSDYQVLVEVDDYQFISGEFSIMDNSVYGLIDLPPSGRLLIGQPFVIKWANTYNESYNYDLSYKSIETGIENAIVNNIPGTINGSNLSYTWTVPVLTEGDYEIIVKEVNGLLQIKSDLVIESINCENFNPNSSRDKTYVKSYTAKDAFSNCLSMAGDTIVVMETISYMDGLGRPVQEITLEASPAGYDWVTGSTFDGLGRKDKQYLPYTATSGVSGTFRDTWQADQPTHISSTYGSTNANYGFSEQVFEASPRNRVIATAAPGEVWSVDNGSHLVEVEYGVNKVSDSVRVFYVEEDVLQMSSVYSDGELTVTTTHDENEDDPTAGTYIEGIVTEYANKQGQVIMKQVRIDQDTNAQTYYVYDEFGNLRMVLPPEGVKAIIELGN